MAKKTLEEKLKDIDEGIFELQEKRKEVIKQIDINNKKKEEKDMKDLLLLLKSKGISINKAKDTITDLFPNRIEDSKEDLGLENSNVGDNSNQDSVYSEGAVK